MRIYWNGQVLEARTEAELLKIIARIAPQVK